MEQPLKRFKYDARFKLKVVKLAKETSDRHAAKVFNVGRTCVQRWKKDEETLKKMPKTKCALRTGIPKWPALENALFTIVLELRLQGNVVSRQTIINEAMKWAFQHPEAAENFQATPSWCARYMERYNLVLRLKTKIA